MKEVKGVKKKKKKGRRKGGHSRVISESARERNIVIYKSDHQSSS